MPSQYEKRLTALFAKRPEPGRVKTRLCPPLTPAQAARLAEGMLRDAAARCAAGDFRSVLVYAPGDAHGWFRDNLPELEDQRPQQGDGLGQRMAHFVADSFARAEARSLVLVGSDQPQVPLERLHEAHRALEAGTGCVLGPDPGGGYYLIGLARSVPELFTGVGMSQPDMCAATEREARRQGLTVTRLAQHSDIDVGSDLERLCAALAAAPAPGRERSSDYPVHTRRALLELSLLEQ